jgi:tetratricopeptide (TPR) repeat protein
VGSFDSYRQFDQLALKLTVPPPAITSQGLESVDSYYEQYLGVYGIQLTVPTAVLSDMAQLADENGETQKAIEYQQYNVSIHPDAALPEFGLAMLYKDAGDKNLAIKHFERALELAPQYETYIKPFLLELRADTD